MPTIQVPINIVLPTVEKWRLYLGDAASLDSSEFVQRVMQHGANNWTIPTYLRLVQRGHDVLISPNFMHDAINVAHYDFVPARAWLRHFFVVSIRADRDPTFIANCEITQNASSISTDYQHFISHWPQPALIPRATHRSQKIEKIAFMGTPENLAVSFQTEFFYRALSDIGIRFVLERRNVHDYREVDAVLAVRDGSPYFLQHKPASKLINAWLAGVPALLGPEPAYREIGRPGENYLEINDPKGAIAAILWMREHPDLYEKIIQNGRLSAHAWDTNSVTRQWENFLYGPATRSFLDWQRNSARRAPERYIRMHYRLLKRRLWGYQYYKGCDETGRILPRSLLGKLRQLLIKP